MIAPLVLAMPWPPVMPMEPPVWTVLCPDQVLVGRAVTCRWVPIRPDLHDAIIARGAKDGRIGFIDFGIVGRIKPSTWESVSKFIWAIGQENYAEMAEAMLGIGMTDQQVDTGQLARDIEALYTRMDKVMPEVDLHAGEMLSINEQEVNKVMMELVGVGKRHGIHFPREFALLLKQLLYFDRYVRLLAMESNIYMDERLNITPDMTWNRIH